MLSEFVFEEYVVVQHIEERDEGRLLESYLENLQLNSNLDGNVDLTKVKYSFPLLLNSLFFFPIVQQERTGVNSLDLHFDAIFPEHIIRLAVLVNEI